MKMVGATTPFFVAILGFLLFNHVHSWQTYASLVPIVGGILLSTLFEGDLSIAGFLLVVTATVFRGLRTCFQGNLLSNEEKLDSQNLLRYMAMNAGAILLVFGILIEGRSLLAWLGSEKDLSLFNALLFLANPLGAYAANLSQFLLIQNSSALTFQVIGNTKGAVTVTASIIVFGNTVAFQSFVGYVITMVGVFFYVREKMKLK